MYSDIALVFANAERSILDENFNEGSIRVDVVGGSGSQ